MKSFFVILFSVWCSLACGQQMPPKPNPPRLVNDFTKTLEPDQVAHLGERLVAYDDSTSVQIAIVIVAGLQDYEPIEFATKLGREWGIGNKKTNNGVLLLVSMEEGKRKVFIAPGYGLEGALPDITCKQIVENEIIPQFKQGNYYRGLSDAADAIILATRGEYKAPQGYTNRNKGGDGTIAFVFILLFVLFILFMGNRGGGPKGGMMSRRGYRDFIPPLIFGPGWGGSGSGGWGGGGSSGGGFGGFGGGSFGGGGAGGSW